MKQAKACGKLKLARVNSQLFWKIEKTIKYIIMLILSYIIMNNKLNILKIPKKYKKGLYLLMKMEEEKPEIFEWFKAHMHLYVNGKLSNDHMKKMKELPLFDAYMWLLHSD